MIKIVAQNFIAQIMVKLAVKETEMNVYHELL